MTQQHDVLIVGAGPAGSTLAAFLAAQGWEVLLVDKAEFPRDKTCGDGVSPRALRVLRQIGAADAVLAAGFRIGQLRVFAPDGESFVCPIPGSDELPAYALVLPRMHLDDLIRGRALAAGAAFQLATVTEVLRDGDRYTGARAQTPDGPLELRARLLVFATGAATAVLERAGLLAEPPAYGRAARTYYENVHGLSDTVEFHFDSVPLPGYGWVFPTSPTTANVGAGYFARAGRPPQRATPRQAFDEFVANPYIAGLLAEAQPTAPIRGYPLRFDFPNVQPAAPGLLLVGEACGLVNPLTGEGIDYAVESAEVAAGVIDQALRAGEPAARTAGRHIRALRDRFLRAFVNIGRVRDLYFQPWVLNRFVRAANHNFDLRLQLVKIALGQADPLSALTPRTLWQVALG